MAPTLLLTGGSVKHAATDIFSVKKFYDKAGRDEAQKDIMDKIPKDAKHLESMVPYYVDVMYAVNLMEMDRRIDETVYANFAVNCIINIINVEKMRPGCPALTDVLQRVMGTFVESMMETGKPHGKENIH